MTAPAGSSDKALADLEWHRLSGAVLARCVGSRAHGSDVPIAETFEGARAALKETSEALSLLERGERLPLEPLPEIREALRRLERQGGLEGPSLRDLATVLRAARALRRFLGARREELPALHAACAFDPTLDGLEEEISGRVGPDGLLFDHASEDLRRLRIETANLRARIVRRLEALLHERASILQDAFYTVREGRYVLPVRRDSHERLEGIVHGTSASGATVFVEPEALIGQGNRLKMALAEQEREEARLFGILSALAGERLPELRAAVDALEHADLRHASARLGVDLEGRILALADDAEIHLVRARHPLLLLDGVQVVPHDLDLATGHGLVLSGPNAGGKTVALKTMGLAALMMRAGLPFPADEGSSVGFFDPVLSDMGDEQSLQKNLSTFSAHVTNLERILSAADARSLVLLDELAGGTDPGEGAALACAVIERLCELGAATAVTTHYEALKALATRDPRLRNAAVGFDVALMRPTFELTLDVPGASSALRVARRFGIPAELIARAEAILPEQSRTFDALVRELEELKAKARSEVEDAASERERAESARASAAEELAKLEARDRSRLGKEAERLRSELRAARDELKSARRRLRDAESEVDLDAARRAIDEAARATAQVESAAKPSAPPERELLASEVAIGERVYVARLRAEAEVLEGPTRGKVRVAAGPMKLWVEVGELRKGDRRAEPKPSEPMPPSPPPRAPSTPTADTTLDVRGLRVDDAVAMTEQFLDRAYGESQSTVYILHGVGSGALREAIREHLGRDSRYVRSTRPGTPEEGGARLTVVELR